MQIHIEMIHTLVNEVLFTNNHPRGHGHSTPGYQSRNDILVLNMSALSPLTQIRPSDENSQRQHGKLPRNTDSGTLQKKKNNSIS
ncbi:hypothetical protein GJAV_G00056150 [Gymnothorax javanicus]|nr:hypothetical protein GJAV_G00056150 [Gymnothorax javanicus]